MVPHPLQVCCPAERHDEVVAVLRAAHLDGLAPRLDDAPGAPAGPTGAPPRVLAELVPEAVAEVEPDLYLWAGAAERLLERPAGDLRPTGPSPPGSPGGPARARRPRRGAVRRRAAGPPPGRPRAPNATVHRPGAPRPAASGRDPCGPRGIRRGRRCLAGPHPRTSARALRARRRPPARALAGGTARGSDPGPRARRPAALQDPFPHGRVRPAPRAGARPAVALAPLSWGGGGGCAAPSTTRGRRRTRRPPPDASIRRSQPSTSGAGTADGQPSGSLSRS